MADDFLSRWSRRKAEARVVPQAAPEPEPPPQLPAALDAEPEPPLDLPDPETLTKDSDFSVFLRQGVPDDLRRLALRKLWRSDPVLANLDGLNDYDGDYTDHGDGVVKTVWQVGKGYLFDEDEEKPAGSAPHSEDGAGAPAIPAQGDEDRCADDPAPQSSSVGRRTSE